jgi:hypothetical protein
MFNELRAQSNVYVNEAGRTRIIHNVDKIEYGTDSMIIWSGFNLSTLNSKLSTFKVDDVNLMSLKEKDLWRAKVMPERYLSDFDYDIAFEESDKALVASEPEVTDVNNKLYDDFVEHSTWDKTVNIAYDGTDVAVTGDTDSITVTKDGAHLTIKTSAAGVKYIITGSSNEACFKLYSEKKARLVLNGVDLTNPQGPVINSQLKKRLFIDIAPNSVNMLTDGTAYAKIKNEDQRGCIFAEGKICISGKGQLYVNGNKKCGIASDDYVHLLGGFVHVYAHAPKGKAVYGKENIIIGGGVLRTLADGDAGKGLSSDSLLTVIGGIIKAITTGNAIWGDTEQDYSSCCAIKSNWDMNILGGQIYCLSTGSGGKGISAGNLETVDGKNKYNGTLTIANADIYVRTGGTRIPEVKHEDSHGNKDEAAASPKGLKSVGKMTINSGNIYVRCSGGAAAEGIESKKTIDINGGKIRTYCVDDGMNAEGCYINGGDILICSTENDGFDVSFLFVNDGLLYTIGGDDAQMGLDTDGKTFKVMGGEVVALGARNCQPYESSAVPSVLCYVKKNISGLALADTDGNIIRAIPTPDTYDIVCALFSNGDITVGNHYKILSYEHSFNDTPVVEYDFTMEKITTTLGSFR